MSGEVCENCRQLISESEQAFVYEGRIVCQSCDTVLRRTLEQVPSQPVEVKPAAPSSLAPYKYLKLAARPVLKRFLWILGLVALLAGISGFVLLRQQVKAADKMNPSAGLFTVKRDDLTISVTESGDIKALDTHDIKCEVEGATTIISIVDEGTYVTEEDVNNGKILVELDSSEIKQKLNQQEISFLIAQAAFTDANESLQIQIKQNESDLKAGQMAVRFALMDFQKYLGQASARTVLDRVAKDPNVGFESAMLIADPNSLGGAASQKLNELTDAITIADSKLKQAQTKLISTEKLYAVSYVSKTELERDRLDVNSCAIQHQQALTALDLYKCYDFPKEAEKLLSGYDEAGRGLVRIEARARSQLAQAQAKVDSTKATYLIEKERLERFRKQFAACVIKARTTGQVVYSSSMMDSWERRQNPIEVGARIRERQKIISIPDPNGMKVEVKIHETWIDKVQLGQEARIVIAAFPDKTYSGKVLKKAPLADTGNWFENPDAKVYATEVSLEGTDNSVRTGMTAKVEIIIDQLRDVLSVPIQSVVTQNGEKVCYVMAGTGREKRVVETGLFNDNFVEIKSGLAEGDVVLLNPPRVTESKVPNGQPKPQQSPAPANTGT